MHDVIDIDAFIRDTKIDIKNSKESTYSNHVSQQKSFVGELYDTFDEDRMALNKLRKAVKAIHSSGMVHIQQEMSLAQHLASLSDRFVRADSQRNDSPLVDEQSIGTSISKFSIFYREQAKLQETLMQNMRNTLLHPLESFLKGAIKGDIKKPVDKAFKEFDNRYEKMRKEMLHQAKENGHDVTPGDLEKSVERERRLLQLSIVKYLIQISEMQSKEGAELVQYLIAFYQAQKTYFTESVKVLEHLGMFLVDVECKVREIKARQDDQRRTLVQVKEDLSRMVVDKETSNVGLGADTAYSLHQPDQVATAGTARSGFLLKRSEGKVKRLWQRRHVAVRDGFLFLSHADETKTPVKLNLLTCHIKPNAPEADPKCFDLLSNNRTYHFQAEIEADRHSWVAVINNAKRAVFDLLMQADSTGPSASNAGPGSSTLTSGGSVGGRSAAMAAADQQLRELRNEVLTAVRQLPGNEHCADCGAGQPEWVSVNLGVLICLECCGLHRELGVHHSRTQSLIMDDLKTSQLLLPRFIGNQVFNEVFESTMPDTVKPSHANGRDSEDTRMDHRKAFIRAKYVDKRYVCGTSATPASLRHDLQNAVTDANMSGLLQCFGEAASVDLLLQFDDLEGETALHLALREGEDSSHLHLVQFLLENSPCTYLARVTRGGDSVLHYACRYNRPESLKLVLRALQTEPSLCSRLAAAGNALGDTAADVASPECARLLQMVLEEGRWELCENVDTDWDLAWCEQGASFCDYFSEEELDGPIEGGLMTTSLTGSSMREAFGTREARGDKDATLTASPQLPPEPVPARRGSIGRPQSLVQAEGQVALRNGGTESPRRVAPARPPKPRMDMTSLPVGCTLPRRGRSNASAGAAAAAAAATTVSAAVSVARRQSLKGPAPPPPKPQASVAPQPAAPPPTPPKPAAVMSSGPPEPPPKRPVPRPRKSTDSTSSIGSVGSVGSNNGNGSGSVSGSSGNGGGGRPSGGGSALASWFGDTELFSSPLSTPHRAETLGRPKKKKRDKKEFGSLDSSRAMSHSTDHINVLLDVLQEEVSGSSDEETEAVGRVCKALFACQADAPGDLAFSEGEQIRVTKVENDQWWHGVIEDDPSRKGLFPVTYVHIIK